MILRSTAKIPDVLWDFFVLSELFVKSNRNIRPDMSTLTRWSSQVLKMYHFIVEYFIAKKGK